MTAAAAMHRHADAFAKAPRELLQAGADALAKALDQAALRATHGSRRLSNEERGRAGPPKVTVTDDSAYVTAVDIVWGILESGTKAHRIGTARPNRVLRIGEGFRIGPVRHPGAGAKHVYSTTVDRTVPTLFGVQRERWEAIHRVG